MTKRLVIGTLPECDILVEDPYVSGKHAAVYLDDAGRFWIEDLGSTNGTFIQRGAARFKVWAEPTEIRVGDSVWLGRFTCIPHSVAADKAEA